ncbi:MAG: hypothetical protein LBH52_00245 [Puniceicoccales bacterium]|jgi:hypothetical protein|nr:hypothetical protein [Puniceicoccales bacterium]
MNKTLLSFLCYFAIAGLCKAVTFEDIAAVVRSGGNDQKILQPLIEQQLKYKGTANEWNVILDRIQQIKSRLNIDVLIVFLSIRSLQPMWCLYTPRTRIEEIKGRKVIIFEIWYDVNLTQLHRPALNMQHLNLDTLRPCELLPYIMLSHEMLHMLLRLDYILVSSSLPDVEKKITDIKNSDFKSFNEFLDGIYPLGPLLIQMENFFELWSGAAETQREELIVILGRIYHTMSGETSILGETQFLREHYGDPNIISWTHLLLEMITNDAGAIVNRKFLENAFLPDCIASCLEAFPFLTN